MACLDVEGVLLPEIWPAIADETGIAALRRTTRDEPDYDALMAMRIAALVEANVRFDDLVACAARIEPLPGASAFLAALRRRYQVALISDSYYEFLQPLGAKLGAPSIFCHRLLRGVDGSIQGWRPRLANQKPKCVRAFQTLGFEVFAAGDSFNDLAMLDAADHAAFVHAPDHVRILRPNLAACCDHRALADEIERAPWRTPAPFREESGPWLH
jgi:phosphoserine/homoserine phosphotransferase